MENNEMTFKDKLKEKLQNFKREFVKNANITRELVKRNIKVQYRNSVIGIFWTVLNPLLNMLVLYIVFSTMFGKDDKTYALYLLCGNILFNMMRGATQQSLTCLVQNRGLLTKNKIAYNVFPLSCNLSAFINFLFSCIALLGVMLVVGFSTNTMEIFSPYLLFTFVMLPALLLFNYGVSLIVSALYVFFRDIQHFYTVFLTLWTYLTPIFYKPEKLFSAANDNNLSATIFRGVLNLNPMYHFVEYFRDIVYCFATGLESSANIGLDTAKLYLIGLAFTAFGMLIFSMTKRKFIFYI